MEKVDSLSRNFWAYGNIDRSSQETSSFLSSTQPSQTADPRISNRVQKKFDDAFNSKRHAEIVSNLTSISTSVKGIEKVLNDVLPKALKELTNLTSAFERLSQELSTTRHQNFSDKTGVYGEEKEIVVNPPPRDEEDETEGSFDDEDKELAVISVAEYLRSRKRPNTPYDAPQYDPFSHELANHPQVSQQWQYNSGRLSSTSDQASPSVQEQQQNRGGQRHQHRMARGTTKFETQSKRQRSSDEDTTEDIFSFMTEPVAYWRRDHSQPLLCSRVNAEVADHTG